MENGRFSSEHTLDSTFYHYKESLLSFRQTIGFSRDRDTIIYRPDRIIELFDDGYHDTVQTRISYLDKRGNVVKQYLGPDYRYTDSMKPYISAYLRPEFKIWNYDTAGYLIRFCDTFPSMHYSACHYYTWSGGNMTGERALFTDGILDYSAQFYYYDDKVFKQTEVEIGAYGRTNSKLLKSKEVNKTGLCALTEHAYLFDSSGFIIQRSVTTDSSIENTYYRYHNP